MVSTWRFCLLCLFCLTAYGAASAQAVFSQGNGPPAFKLYCIGIANIKHRSDPFHFYARSCPANSETCPGKRQPFVVKNEGRHVGGAALCEVQSAPIEFEIAFDGGNEDGYQEQIAILKPQVFAWRGRTPSAACIDRSAFYRFTAASAGIVQGYVPGTQRGRCQWDEEYNAKFPRADIGLPPSLVGSWVEQGAQCPGVFDGSARAAKMLWIQPHAVERGSGACWLVGRFNLGPTFTAGALCASDKGFARTDFIFDRIGDTSMRIREGRGRRRTYTRCSKDWMPDPDQVKAADTLSRLRHRSVFDIKLKARTPGGKPFDDAHKRSFELDVDDKGRVDDRMRIDENPPKTFKTRFGEVVLDSAGDRATWLVKEERLVRARERAGYYEIVSWPLGPDGKSVACEGSMELIASRSDKNFYTVGADGVRHEVLDFKWSSSGCPPADKPLQTARDDGKKPPSGASPPALDIMELLGLSEKKSGSSKTDDGKTDAGPSLPNWAKEASEAGGCNSRDPDVAIKACTAMIDAGTKTAETYNNRAASYLQKGELNRALDDLNIAIRLDPKPYAPRINRGLVLAKMGKHELAIKDFDEAIRLAPLPIRPYRHRARALAALGQHARAIKDFDEALKYDRGNATIQADRKASVKALAATKDGVKSEDILWCFGKKAVSGQKSVDACSRLIGIGLVNPDGSIDRGGMAGLHYYRGAALGQLRKFDDALADFEKAVSLAPDRAVYYNYRAAAHAGLGHRSEAISDRKKACAMDQKFCK